jgi:hypothetical protein
MSQITIPASATDQNSPGDQTLMDALRLNATDHESRIVVLEDPNSRTFSHFNSRHNYTNNRIVNGAASDQQAIYEELFMLVVSAGSADDIRWVESAATSDTTFQHWIMAEAVQQAEAQLYTVRGFKFSDVTKPIIYKARIKLSDNTDDYWLGLARAEYASFAVPARGIYLERNTTNWRFVSKDSGGSTNGTPFSPVTAGTWFEIEIKFEDSPGNQARCYVDGVLKETFTTNLPTGEVLFGAVKYNQTTGGGGGDLKLDRIEYKAGAQLGNAA